MNSALPPQLQEYDAISIDRTDDDLAVKRSCTFSVLPQLSVCASIEGCETILPRHEDIGLSVVFDKQWRGMSRSDGAVFFPSNVAGLFIEPDQVAGPRMMVPWEQDSVVQYDGTQAVSPGHFRIIEDRQVASDPNQFTVVRITSDVCVGKGNIDRIGSNGRSISGKVGFFVCGLMDATTKIMSPKFVAIRSVEAERQ